MMTEDMAATAPEELEDPDLVVNSPKEDNQVLLVIIMNKKMIGGEKEINGVTHLT